MAQQIFVNLPVKDLAASRDFFTALGYPINPMFSDDNAACVVFSDTIHAMLLTEPFFKGFTAKPIVDATAAVETITCLGVESRARVDELVDRAIAAGGRAGTFSADEGFMYGRSFSDLDGHSWEVMWMDTAAATG